MKYSKIPPIYKKFIEESDLNDLYERDWYERDELDETGCDYVAEYLDSQFRPVVQSIGLDGPDDFGISAYLEAGPWASEKNKDETVTAKLHGAFQFCVYGCEQYGKKAFSVLSQALKKAKFKGFTISDLSSLQNTPGISFNGIYQTDDMIYIAGDYEFDEVVIDVVVAKTQKYTVEIKPYDASDFVGVRMKIEAPKGASDEELRQIVADNYEDKLLKLTKFNSVEFTKYEDDYFDCKVKITFARYPYTIYVDNLGGIPLKYNDETSARTCAWRQFLEDMEVEDVSWME